MNFRTSSVAPLIISMAIYKETANLEAELARTIWYDFSGMLQQKAAGS